MHSELERDEYCSQILSLKKRAFLSTSTCDAWLLSLIWTVREILSLGF